MSAKEWPSVDWRTEATEESGDFKDAVNADISGVFLNTGEFAERRSIRYDGEIYENIPVVLNGNIQQNRFHKRKDPTGQPAQDHMQGIYLASCVLHCALSDLGGNRPEKGARLSISDEDDDAFLRDYYVAASNIEMGMLRVELEAMDE